MYAKPLQPCIDGRRGLFAAAASSAPFPTLRMWLAAGPADVVVLVYGGMVSDAMLCAERLMMDEELSVHVVAATQLSPLPVDDLLELLPPARLLVTVEEAEVSFGWGAEVLAMLAERAPRRYERMLRHGASSGQVPASRVLEAMVLPDGDSLGHLIVRSLQ